MNYNFSSSSIFKEIIFTGIMSQTLIGACLGQCWMSKENDTIFDSEKGLKLQACPKLPVCSLELFWELC